MAAFERLVERLGAGRIGQRTGKTTMARCPGPNHRNGDRNPSLSISPRDDGRGVVLCCHAGCATGDILGALNMTTAELFDDYGNGHNGNGHAIKTPAPPADESKHELYDSAKAAAMSVGDGFIRRYGRKALLESHKYYVDGILFGVVVRCDPPKGKKQFMPISRLGDKWVIKAGSKLWPLFRIDELPADGTVYVCEGEKATDAAHELGLAATTSQGGSNRPKGSDWSTLAGRDVVILPDNDKPGDKYADTVAGILTGLFPPAIVRIVELPDRPDGGDIADLIPPFPDDDELAGLLQTVETLTAEATPIAIEPATSEPPTALFPATDDEHDAEHDGPTDNGLVWEPFPLNCLPDELAAFVTNRAESISVDPALVVSPLLASLATVIGNTRSVQMKPGWHEPAILWTMAVADSGGGKSPAYSASLSFLEEIELRLEAGNRELAITAEQQARAYEATLSAWRADAKKMGADDAGPAPTEPESYVPDAIIISDTTVEALAPMLSHNTRGLLLARDELSGWIAGFDRYSGGGGKVSAEVGQWLELHSGKPIRINRVRGGRVFVSDPRLSITGGIQPKILRAAIGNQHTDNGLLQRFLICEPPRQRRRFDTPPIDYGISEAVRRIFNVIYDEKNTGIVPLTPEAERVFREFFHEHARRQSTAAGPVAGAMAKTEATAGRLALLISVARMAAIDGDTTTPISGDDMAAGVTLANWYLNEWMRLHWDATDGGDAEAEQMGRAAEAVNRYLKDHGGDASRKSLYRGVAMLGGPEGADRVISYMVKTGAVETYTRTRGGGAGRPSERIRRATPPAEPAVNATPIDEWLG